MDMEGLSADAVESVTHLGEVRCGRTNSRSVLGSMNDLAFQHRVELDHRGDGGRMRGLTGARLNRIPMGAIGYRYAIDALRSELSVDLH